jgi:hypothetical protein
MNDINSQGYSYKNPSTGAKIAGILTGSIVCNVITNSRNLVSPQILNRMIQMNEKLSPDEFQTIEKSFGKVLENEGLAKKGVEIIRASEGNSKEISNILQNEFNSNSIMKKLPEFIKNFYASMFSNTLTSGQNACYTFASKKIIMPEKGLHLAIFHEMGHAANANLSKFGKILQKSRMLAVLAVPIALIAIYKTKKATDQESKGKIDKTTTFIKENAGKLTFAACMPMVLEEGLASIKGNKFASKVLSPELAKKVAKTNALGFSTYIILATLLSLGVYTGVKVKDKIAQPKLIKTEA